MKIDVLKKLIKESVKEAIHEEIKDVLLEALKSNNKDKSSYLNPPYTVSHLNPSYTATNASTVKTEINLREKYNQALNETTLNFTSQDVPKFSPPSSVDSVNGKLPDGDVDLSQIMGLLK